MNKEGFTLVELLATIAILGVVIAILVPGVNIISKAIQTKSRNNLIKNIEIKAADYAFDTGKTLIFVDELIKSGYLSGDEEDNLKDPLNKTNMNCYLVKMEKVSDYYKATFIDGKIYENSGTCDESKKTIENAN